MAVQVNLEDKIPFVDAECSCDGSVSSIGTGSLLGHSTTSEEFISENSKANGQHERLWEYRQPVKQDLMTDDQQSLNNILDTVSSSRDSLDGPAPTKAMMTDSPTSCKIIHDDYEKMPRPSSLSIMEGKVKKLEISARSQEPTPPGGYVSLMSAYTSLSEQQVTPDSHCNMILFVLFMQQEVEKLMVSAAFFLSLFVCFTHSRHNN